MNQVKEDELKRTLFGVSVKEIIYMLAGMSSTGAGFLPLNASFTPSAQGLEPSA